MSATVSRSRSHAYCRFANKLIRIGSKSGRRCGSKGSRSFGSTGNLRIDADWLGRRCIVDIMYLITENGTDVDPEEQLSLTATAGAFWVFEVCI